MSPTSPFPTETLTQIFEEAYVHTPYGHCSERAIHVIRLTHVSRRWRQIAISLPQLWRCIHVEPSQPLMELFLSRSGKHPISVTFEKVEGSSKHPQQENLLATEWPVLYGQALKALLRHARCISYLMIRTDSILLMTNILPCLSSLSLSHLKYLDLTLNNFPAPVAPLQLQLPELCCLRLGTISISFSACYFPSLQTAYLEIGEVTNDALYALGKNAPQLSNLIISESYLVDNFGPLIPFLHLEALTLQQVNEDELGSFLNSLDAPALSSLSLVSIQFKAAHRERHYFNNSPRTFPAVSHLCLHNITTAVGVAFDYILPYTPNISFLKFHGSDTAHTYLFNYYMKRKLCLLKSLKTLHFTNIQINGENGFNMLIRLVKSRKKIQCPLEELILGKNVYDCISEDDMRRLNESTKVILSSNTDIVTWPDIHWDRFHLTP